MRKDVVVAVMVAVAMRLEGGVCRGELLLEMGLLLVACCGVGIGCRQISSEGL